MNIVKNIPIKRFLELSNKAEVASEKLNQLDATIHKCFNMQKQQCGCCETSSKPHYHNVNKFNENEFDSLIARFDREIILKDKFRQDVEEYLNYQMDVDIKVYMNMVETVNQYIDKKLYHKTLVTKEEKEKYAKFMVEGIKTKRNIID